MLAPRSTPNAAVTATADGWRLQIPAGPAGTYRLAQLDDYARLPRGRFPLKNPTDLSLRCRVSSADLPGTWGFGFWNDPFMFSFGLQGTARRLPVLPNAAWFFHASPRNHLSLRDPLPGSGFLAQSFCAPHVPSLLLAPGLVALPLLFSRTFSKWIRAICARIIDEDGALLSIDVTQWHAYQIAWHHEQLILSVDGQPVLKTGVSPRAPLALVIWIDNQFAAFTPQGKISAGTEANPVPAWIEIEGLVLS